MARAYRCDRCPNLYEKAKPLSAGGEIYETESDFYRVQFRLEVEVYNDPLLEPELCPPCRIDILNAIIGKLKPAAEPGSEG